jgi:hypothetical protein
VVPGLHPVLWPGILARYFMAVRSAWDDREDRWIGCEHELAMVVRIFILEQHRLSLCESGSSETRI